jgi:hypothetical protein
MENSCQIADSTFDDKYDGYSGYGEDIILINITMMICSMIYIAIRLYNIYTINQNNARVASDKNKKIFSLMGLFEVIKTDGTNETKNLAIGNFKNIAEYPNISARDYINFIPRFLRDDFKFNKYRVICISLNNGSFNEIHSSMQQKNLLDPTIAYFKAFNCTHYYMKLIHDLRVIDIFRDVFPTVLLQNNAVIKDIAANTDVSTSA